ncbi:large repetitive protein [Salmonella enterica subsp. arizonae]|uniref:Large repetitive protein n=1 Tax=Salmonella enterica subsp. arizonae TaxID=59203 RepID=A0A379T0Z2_SALER|nr:large repetitive protein [Salmonella enterica subsp. arizonae]
MTPEGGKLTLPKDAEPGLNEYTVTSEDLAGNTATITGNFNYVPIRRSTA